MKDIWFEKYRPKTLDDLIISNLKKEQIVNWFTKFKEGASEQNAILLMGPPGLGKTSLAHAILKEFNYFINEFNASDVRSKSLVEEYLSGLINSPKNCFASLMKSYSKKVELPVNGIIMDEVDGMFKGDRGGIEALLNYISFDKKSTIKRKVPIICICNVGNVKKETLNSLKKECFTIEFTSADNLSLSKLFERVAEKEKMLFDEDSKKSILEYSQGDFRRLVNILEFLYLIHGENKISLASLDKCYDILMRKEQDLYITDNIRELINKRLDPYKIQSIYNGDKCKAPMVIHQNYIRTISALKIPALSKIDLALIVIKSLITSDVIEKIMYNTQNWGLQPIQGYSCAHVPNYYMNICAKTTFVDAKWASVLSINSQAQNLRKNVYLELHKISAHKTYNISDLQQIIELVFILLINGEIEESIDMLFKYNLCNIDDEDVSSSKISAEFNKKKALVVIDKLAKYIKISPYYSQWNIFKNENKNNKVLDAKIKDYILIKNTPEVTVNINLVSGKKKCLTVKKKPIQREILPLINDETVSNASCASSTNSISSTNSASSASSTASTSLDKDKKIKLSLKIKQDVLIQPSAKTIDQQKEIVSSRRKTVIAKKF